jgi:hypothetical protein
MSRKRPPVALGVGTDVEEMAQVAGRRVEQNSQDLPRLDQLPGRVMESFGGLAERPGTHGHPVACPASSNDRLMP